MVKIEVEVKAAYTLPLLSDEPTKQLLGLEEEYLGRELHQLFGSDAVVTFTLREVADGRG